MCSIKIFLKSLYRDFFSKTKRDVESHEKEGVPTHSFFKVVLFAAHTIFHT